MTFLFWKCIHISSFLGQSWSKIESINTIPSLCFKELDDVLHNFSLIYFRTEKRDWRYKNSRSTTRYCIRYGLPFFFFFWKKVSNSSSPQSRLHEKRKRIVCLYRRIVQKIILSMFIFFCVFFLFIKWRRLRTLEKHKLLRHANDQRKFVLHVARSWSSEESFSCHILFQKGVNYFYLASFIVTVWRVRFLTYLDYADMMSVSTRRPRVRQRLYTLQRHWSGRLSFEEVASALHDVDFVYSVSPMQFAIIDVADPYVEEFKTYYRQVSRVEYQNS